MQYTQKNHVHGNFIAQNFRLIHDSIIVKSLCEVFLQNMNGSSEDEHTLLCDFKMLCYSAIAAVECDQGATPVIVPILVGSALGLFVIILLLAYVIGRLRQRRARSGYSRL